MVKILVFLLFWNYHASVCNETIDTERVSVTIPQRNGRGAIVCSVVNSNKNTTHITTASQQTVSMQSDSCGNAQGVDATSSTSVFKYLCDSWLTYKAKLILGLCGVTYGSLVSLVWISKKIISQENRWALWRHELIYDELCKIPAHELAAALLQEIKKRYDSEVDGTQGWEHLVQFEIDTLQELQQLRWLEKLQGFLEYSRVSMLLPSQMNSRQMLQEQQKRLQYLKHILIQFIKDSAAGTYAKVA